MKKLLVALLLQGFAVTAIAQTEPFVKSLRQLQFGSNILDAGMLFKRDFAQFTPVVQRPILVTTVQDPDNDTNTFKIEAYYQISEDRKQLVQLYYVNNKLYEKGAYWFYEATTAEDIAEVEKKYTRCVNYFKSDWFFIHEGHGIAQGSEHSSNKGKKTTFPVDEIEMDLAQGEAGYEVIYSKEEGAKGFWVYMEGMNSVVLDIPKKMELPSMKAPEVPFDQVKEAILSMEDAQ